MLCPSVRWLQRILDVCQAYAELHGIIFSCNKTVCMTFKAKSAKSTATPALKLGGQYIKSVDRYKYLGIVLDTELSDDKDIQRQSRYQYCAANKLRASFSRCSNAVKNVRFRFFCTPMHRRTGRHFTGAAEKLALKITFCPKNKQFALKLIFLV